MDVEKKTKFCIVAVALLLAGIGGAVVGFKVAGIGRSGLAQGSGLDDREVEKLERSLEEGSQRSAERIEGAISAAGSIEERERSALERYGNATESARSLEDSIGRIGEDAAGVGDGLEDLGGIVEELRKRGRTEDP